MSNIVRKHSVGENDPVVHWISAVKALRITAEQDKVALAMLMNVPHWRIFIAAWREQQEYLSEAGTNEWVPDDIRGMDDRLGYCWSLVNTAVDDVLELIACRLPISDLETIHTFDVLQGGKIIYPDGSVHRGAISLSNAMQARYETGVQRQITSNILKSAEHAHAYKKITGKDMM